jgi:BA14K-like protein
MISLKVLSTAAAIALVLPLALPAASFAQNQHGGRAGVARGPGGGGAAFRGGGGQFRPGPGAAGPRFSGGGGGGYRGGYRGGGYRGGGAVVPGIVAGAVIGGAIASQGYYGGPAYAPGYYDDQQYYDDGPAVAVVPAPAGGDDGTAYCMQTYRSYDPQSGTYLGFDGQRHPCP